MTCPHEDDINYGKSISIEDDKYIILNMHCVECNAVGTQLEQRNEEYPEQYDFIDCNWHEPTDYFRSDLAVNMTIKLNMG